MSLTVHDGGKRGAWMKALEKSDRGGWKPSYLNATIALADAPEWKGVIGYDEFALRTLARRGPPWGAGHGDVWTDHHDLLALRWLQELGIHVSIQVCSAAVQAVAISQRFHPVREWLDGLKWDGEKRIHEWLIVYLGVTGGAQAEKDPDRRRDLITYCEAVGPRWLVSAVARIYQPGAKVDCVLVLEGPQGAKKSSALRALTEPWFTDDLAVVGSKDAAEQLRGAWLVEMAELNALSKAELAATKSFISRAVDRYRPSYGRRVIEAHRQCVFAGTVNPSEYLRDETGARRSWPWTSPWCDSTGNYFGDAPSRVIVICLPASLSVCFRAIGSNGSIDLLQWIDCR